MPDGPTPSDSFPSDFQDLLRGVIRGRSAAVSHRKPTSVVEVPLRHREKFYRLLRAVGERPVSSTKLALWAFTNKILPESAECECGVDTSEILHPRVEIYGRISKPTVGVDGVLAVYPLPAKFRKRAIALADARDLDGCHLTQFKLWSFLAKCLGDKATSGDVQLTVGVEFTGVVRISARKHPSEPKVGGGARG